MTSPSMEMSHLNAHRLREHSTKDSIFVFWIAKEEKEAREKVRGACLIFRESCDLEEVLENLISNQE